MVSYTGRQIYLIGANSLLNELLAHLIAEKTGATCTAATTLRSIPQSSKTAQKRLVLFDFDYGRDSLENLITSDTNNILQNDYVVLINLSNKLNIECEALRYGVRGFLYYQGGIGTLFEMIDSVLNAELWVSRELMTKLLLEGGLKRAQKPKEELPALTAREVNILSGIAEGLTNAQIADTHCLSPHTVKTHIYHIFKKINVSNRLMAARWAAQNL
jgi:DNA-binding NarL/FixJ family response regulator